MGLASLLVSCCGAGIGGVLAVLLGVMARDRIRASNGSLRGIKFAWWGIGMGTAAVIVSIASQWIIGGLQESLNSQLDAGVRTTFAAIDAPGETAALSKWRAAPGTSLDAREIGEFARLAQERYGRYESFTVLSEDPRPSLTGTHELIIAAAFQFERARVIGSIDTTIGAGVEQLAPRMELRTIRIADATLGNIALPVSAATTASPASTTDTPSTSTTPPATTPATTP